MPSDGSQWCAPWTRPLRGTSDAEWFWCAWVCLPLPGAAFDEQQQYKDELTTTGTEPCTRQASVARVSRPFAGRPECLSPEPAPFESEGVALPERWEPTVCRAV